MDSEKLFDLSGKLALITGASRGIGAEAAKTLARFGARVILSSRKREGLDGIAQEITKEGFEAMVRPCHCLLYTSPSPRDVEESRMPSSA